MTCGACELRPEGVLCPECRAAGGHADQDLRATGSQPELDRDTSDAAAHLAAALEATDNADARYHIRQALQHVVIAREDGDPT